MSPLLLLLLGVSGVYCDSHTLRYFYTAVSGPGSGLPEYSTVGYVDDQQIDLYSSNTGRKVPVAPWMNREGPEYWDGQTQISKGNEAVFRYNVRTAMSRFNQTAGIHIFQLMSGCELRDDGSTEGYEQYGYDGREFTHLDTQSWEWIPTMQEAQITTQRWNSPEEREGERNKNYLQHICVYGLKRYIEYGKEDLERRVRPEVKVWGRQSEDGVTRLQCLAYGFHPKVVDVKWVRNGEDDVQSYEYSPILPHPDGTYQKRVSVEVPTREGDTYACHVDHSSLEEPLSVIWEPESGPLVVVIVGAALVCLLLLSAVIGVIVYKKRNGGYKSTSTTDTNSDSSKNPRA